VNLVYVQFPSLIIVPKTRSSATTEGLHCVICPSKSCPFQQYHTVKSFPENRRRLLQESVTNAIELLLATDSMLMTTASIDTSRSYKHYVTSVYVHCFVLICFLLNFLLLSASFCTVIMLGVK